MRTLRDLLASPRAELVVVYGRRRIGKSQLVREFLKTRPDALAFEALEGVSTKAQIRHFVDTLRGQTKDPFLANASFSRWEEVFSYLNERVLNRTFPHHRPILFLDELQWMAAGRSRLVSLLKYHWDNRWKQRKLLLILCGSVASFMVEKVIRSKALYGRISAEILLRGLPPDEAARLFRGRRSLEEILKYLLVFGGVPKYLEDVRLDRSFSQNMNRLCFTPGAPMLNEVGRMFFNQFRESETYRRIVSLLKDRPAGMVDISRRLRLSSGGGLRRYLNNLELAEVIRAVAPFDKARDSKLRRYALADEFLDFYFHFMEPALETIQGNELPGLFERLTSDRFEAWLGTAFERFCLKHAAYLAHRMGFAEYLLSAAPLFQRGKPGFQVDLLFRRSDKVVTLCEIKHRREPITTKIIPDVERKCALFRLPRGHTLERALISLHGPDPALKDAGYFHHSLNLSDILGAKPP